MSWKRIAIICSGTQSALYFFQPHCSSSSNVGVNCSVPNRACNILQPCLNNGTCRNINSTLLGYNCSCVSGFNGEICQSDDRVCRPDSCWNDGASRERNERSYLISFVVGTCIQRSNTTFQCRCTPGWEDENCQTKINYCSDDSCLNGGVCQSSLLNHSCLCLAGSYSGPMCEVS